MTGPDFYGTDGTSASLSVVGGTFAANVAIGAEGLGGGIAVGAGGTASIDAVIAGNSALGASGYGGGLYYATGATVSTGAGTIRGNHARTAGSDIYGTGSIS